MDMNPDNLGRLIVWGSLMISSIVIAVTVLTPLDVCRGCVSTVLDKIRGK